ncbi:MAG: serine/threonine-protein phosphatase [Ignavibacteriae bacterium]|nr:serine/threonine-protein phosphatase [Ignavibacteriota bacterium]
MDQHRLYRTIQLLSDEKFRTDEELLGYVLENIIKHEQIPIKGGRIWKLEPTRGTYRLILQNGDLDSIKRNFRLRILDYPMFLQLPRKTTIVGTETNKYLIQKGIKLYSATGVGEKVRWKGHDLYPYVIGINADYLKVHMTYALKIIGIALTAALKRRQIETKAKQLELDLDRAREIQKSILPEHELKFHNYEIYGISIPDRIVGGDFFDYLQATGDRDRIGLVVGDAASKGLSAAAQALYVSGALRMGIEFQTKTSTFIGRINQLVNKAFTPEHFVSLVYVELTRTDKGLVLYVNAGHSNPILLRANSGEAEMLAATGQIIGPFPNEKYRSDFTLMNKGDILVLYTDGITEAFNENREMYGERRLMEKVREHQARTPKELCQLVIEDVQKHNRLVEYSDDKTLVVIKRTK